MLSTLAVYIARSIDINGASQQFNRYQFSVLARPATTRSYISVDTVRISESSLSSELYLEEDLSIM